MATKGYMVCNLTHENHPLFVNQYEAFKNAFAQIDSTLILINNLDAYDTIKADKEASFILFYDKDIALMYRLMSLKIKIFNNIMAMRLCDDKALSYAKYISYKVRTPKTLVLPIIFFDNVLTYLDRIKEYLTKYGINYPFVVKERRNSFGLGVYLVNNDEELIKLLKEIGKKDLLFQEYIGYERGVDYRVYLINHRPQITVMRKNDKDFRSNVAQGGVMSLVDKPDDAILRLAIKASLACKMDFGAVDIVKDKDGKYYVLENNSNARTARLDKLSSKNISLEVAKYIVETN